MLEVMTWVYRAVALLLFVIVAKDFWEEKSISAKIGACMVMVPLVLRVLMIK